MNISQSETELSVIKKIMEDSRNIVADNGWHYIFWGVSVTCALIANYIMALNGVKMNYQGMMWFIVMTGTWIVEGIIERRKAKKRKERTFGGRLLGALWSASGISMFMFGFIGVITHAYTGAFICPIISTVLGATYIISGAIQQTRWMQLLSIGWWGGAIYTFLFPSVHTLLIFAVMMISFQTIPGIILFRKWKRNPLVTD
ncbi:MAG: hypothetical protein ABI543_00675 [Ignavibacteria bacterium]